MEPYTPTSRAALPYVYVSCSSCDASPTTAWLGARNIEPNWLWEYAESVVNMMPVYSMMMVMMKIMAMMMLMMMLMLMMMMVVVVMMMMMMMVVVVVMVMMTMMMMMVLLSFRHQILQIPVMPDATALLQTSGTHLFASFKQAIKRAKARIHEQEEAAFHQVGMAYEPSWGPSQRASVLADA